MFSYYVLTTNVVPQRGDAVSELSESDLTLLRVVHRLTEAHAGRPPSLAEIARELGLAPSSRSNIQRQLQRLRPQYIDWGTTARSLKLSDIGVALVTDSLLPNEDITATAARDIVIDDEILPLLASGLTAVINSLETHGRLIAPYPRPWPRAINRLAAECFRRGIMPPSTSAEAFDWCRMPAGNWPVRFEGYPRLLEEPLLDGDSPSDLCRELARDVQWGDAEEQSCERRMKKIMAQAQLDRNPAGYTAMRRLLIEHPVLPPEDLIRQAVSPVLGKDLGKMLHQLYEPIPETYIVDGHVELCGRCGWTLMPIGDQRRCDHDEQCRRVTHDFTRDTRRIEVRPVTPHLRVRKAIRRYVTAPGKAELDAANQLGDLGLQVDLWPGFDTYDLRLIFPDGEIWAVDVKDWKYPRLLAKRLLTLRDDYGCRYDHASYAVPDSRATAPNYLDILRPFAARNGVVVESISDLVARARAKQEAHDA